MQKRHADKKITRQHRRLDRPREARTRLSMLASIREGLAYIRRDPVLRWVVVLTVATALFTRPYIQLLPAEAQLLGVGALELSWLLAASGVGALGGALLTASLGGWKRRGALLVGSALGHGLLLALFAEQRTVIGAMVFIGLTSFAVMVFLGMANTLMQTRTPDHLRGRAMSVHTMVFMGCRWGRCCSARSARWRVSTPHSSLLVPQRAEGGHPHGAARG